jgi:hemoglobin
VDIYIYRSKLPVMTATESYANLDAEANAVSPFAKIGGSAAVSGVVDTFYERLLADPATAHFFTPLIATDGLGRLKRHQVLLLTKVLGGPDRYDGRDLGTAHAALGITAADYQRVSLHLLTVLHDAGVPMDILQAADSVLRDAGPAIITG